MYIDEESIKNGIEVGFIKKLIEKHESGNDKLNKMYDYYIGNHAILKRERKSRGTANNRIVCNHAKYIVDMEQSYITGNELFYSASEGIDIEPLKNVYYEQDIAGLDSEIIKHTSIYGVAYERVFANENNEVKSDLLNPQNTFVCYSADAEEKKLFAVYYYKKYDIDGMCTGSVCNVYDAENIYKYESRSEGFDGLVLKEIERHYFGQVPIIEYKNNRERQGDIEQMIPLIDAYNTLCSDRVNDKEQFVDSFLLLKNIEIDTDQVKKLKEEKILMALDEKGSAEYISKTMSENNIKILRDDLKDDIHRFSMVPCITDESFGNNLSGVAIKYKLLGFEQKVRNKERYFKKGLKERFSIYNNYLFILNRMQLVPTHKVDIDIRHNLPSNELEISQMITNLKDSVCNETLISRLPFVVDAKEEDELFKREKEENYKRKIEEISDMAAGGGY